jgi:integrase
VHGARQRRARRGRPEAVRFAPFRTRQEAERWRVAKLKEYHETGEVFEPTKLTVAEYLEQWLADPASGGRSPATLSDYGVAIRRHITPATGSLPLPRLTPARRDFRRLLAKAGLPTMLRIHDLRHTVATLLVGGGVDPKTAQALLRHSRITTTLGIYTHLQPGLAEQAVQHLRSLPPRDGE